MKDFWKRLRVKSFIKDLEKKIDKVGVPRSMEITNLPEEFEGIHFVFLKYNQSPISLVFRLPEWKVMVTYTPNASSKEKVFSLWELKDGKFRQPETENSVPVFIQGFCIDCVLKDPSYFENLVQKYIKDYISKNFGQNLVLKS